MPNLIETVTIENMTNLKVSPKKALLEQLLEQGMVLVILDARLEDVAVPQKLKTEMNLKLNLSRRFGRPLEMDEQTVFATLTFGGEPYNCVLPFYSIYMMFSYEDNEPYLFPNDVPKELTQGAVWGFKEMNTSSPKTKKKLQRATTRKSASKQVRPNIQVIKGEGSKKTKRSSITTNTKNRGTHLRVIK